MKSIFYNAYCQFSQQACTNFMQTYLYFLLFLYINHQFALYNISPISYSFYQAFIVYGWSYSKKSTKHLVHPFRHNICILNWCQLSIFGWSQKDIYFLLRDKMWENVFVISDLNGFFVSFTILKSERSGLITLQRNRAYDIYFFPS